MLTVMLVDDEINVIEGLKVSLDWEKHGFGIICTAGSGEEGYIKAIEHKPDLIITDISMHKMDGIEMAEKIREKQPELSIIFLTCHKDFDFARKAVNLSIDEYLIKDTMTREEIYLALAKVKTGIEERWLKKKKTRELSIELNRNRCQLSEKLINELLKKELADINSFERRLNIYNYNLSKQKYILSLLTIDRYINLLNSNMFNKDAELIQFTVLNVVEEILKKNDIGEVFPKSENNYVIIFNYNPNLKYSMYEKIAAVSKEIQSCIKEILKTTCTIYIGIQVGSMQEIKGAYEDILTLKNNRFYMQDGFLLSYSKRESKFSNIDFHYVNDLMKEFDHHLENRDIELLTHLEYVFFDKVKKENIFAVDVKMVVERLVNSLNKYIEKNVFMYQHVIPDSYLKQLCIIDNVYELNETFHSFLKNAVDVLNKNAAYTCTPEMKKILNYITENLQEEISLDTIAAFVNMNSSYFSRYFKSKTGGNFIDFLTSMRVEKAKELLAETDLSIEEISIKVGHVNKAYFTKVFKKVTGFNPGEFRKRRYS
ncbi:response regulator transcription factor [Anaerocolumna xylanovorans]|uniref:Stage 0 sporulation protein A homolog n=1 Tax=Anaerocolumna xylanovorans DSM 12503 TaxID=1121345 RepID=A0A1M7YII8_9FIRM|nr:response regulator [Anaerocolumna xylanovorans]SHO52406.1 Two-component response regulator, YesN/AraC family, consists of REC and AraC-type DNA-binding domains [Anaerocolumna xylanovorans DSM 12503]